MRLTQIRPPPRSRRLFGENGWRPGDAWIAETTLGRVLFNELLPRGYPFVNEQMHKKVQARIINDLAERYPMIVVAQTVDKLKDAGFYWATRSGVTVSMADVLVPPEKAEIPSVTRRRPTIERKYQRGALNHRGSATTPWSRSGRRPPKRSARRCGALPDDNPIITIASGATVT